MKAPICAIRVEYVDPRRATHSDEIMRRLDLDRHMASTCLMALRGLENTF